MKTTLHYSEDLVERAVVAFWLHHFEWKFWAAMLLTAACTAYLVVLGDRSWLVGAVGAVLVVGLGVAASSFITQRRSALQRLRNLGLLEVTIEVHEAHLRMESGAGSSEIPWKLITEVWTYPDFWLVCLSPSQFFTLPTEDLTEEMRATLMARIIANGAKVA